MVGEQPSADHPEGDIDMARALDLAIGAHCEAVGIEQESHHGLRVVGCGSPAILAVVALEGRQIHLLHRIEDEEGEVVLGQPVGDRWRQEVELVALWGEKVAGHGPFSPSGQFRCVHTGEGRMRPPT